MLISKIAKVCHGCATYYKLVLVKFFNTNITYLNQIFESNENNDREKRNSDASTRGWFAAETCDKN